MRLLVLLSNDEVAKRWHFDAYQISCIPNDAIGQGAITKFKRFKLLESIMSYLTSFYRSISLGFGGQALILTIKMDLKVEYRAYIKYVMVLHWR